MELPAWAWGMNRSRSDSIGRLSDCAWLRLGQRYSTSDFSVATTKDDKCHVWRHQGSLWQFFRRYHSYRTIIWCGAVSYLLTLDGNTPCRSLLGSQKTVPPWETLCILLSSLTSGMCLSLLSTTVFSIGESYEGISPTFLDKLLGQCSRHYNIWN